MPTLAGCVTGQFKLFGPGILRRLRRNVDIILLFAGIIYLIYLLRGRGRIPEPEVKPSVFKDSSEDGPIQQRLPNALIIGAPKCGTRALMHFIQINPKIRVADGQVNFFNKGENFNQGIEWYRKQMPFTSDDMMTVERSPGYFIEENVPERIREVLHDNVKLILIVRDPTMRMISDYAQLRANHKAKNLKPPEFETLIFDQKSSLVNTENIGVKESIYHTYLKKWLDIFRRNQIIIVDGDSFIKDPVPELQKVEKFLGVKPLKITDKGFQLNKTSGYYCLKTSSGVNCLDHTKDWDAPQVDARTLRTLQLFFRFHNDKFYKLANQTFQWS